MSITASVPDSEGIAHTAVGHRCFFCGRALSDPAVFWAGETGEIFLDPECVASLSTRLLRDLHEVQNPRYYQRRALR